MGSTISLTWLPLSLLSGLCGFVLVFSRLICQKSTETRTEKMTYGWKRAEIIGAVMNGCFLLALCMYIVLEAIPKFIKPVKPTGDWLFVGTAAAGLGVNLIGTIIFARNCLFLLILPRSLGEPRSFPCRRRRRAWSFSWRQKRKTWPWAWPQRQEKERKARTQARTQRQGKERQTQTRSRTCARRGVTYQWDPRRSPR